MTALPEAAMFPLVAGTLPGVIDTSQRERLLRSPSIVLCFATFNALTAAADRTENDGDGSHFSTYPGHKLSWDRQRIVVETDVNTGICTWRFIPLAKLDTGVNDEGVWPRLVQLCGRVVRMTQDQWDIHKLDREYECVVHAPSTYTTINRRLPAADIPQDRTSTLPHVISGVHATPEKFVRMEGTTPFSKSRAAPVPLSNEGPSSPRTTKRTENVHHSPNQMSVDGDAEPHIFHDQPTPKAAKNKRSRGRRYFEKERSTGPSVYQASSSESDTDTLATKRTRVYDPPPTSQRGRSRKVDRERKRKAQQDARVQARQNDLKKHYWDQLGIPIELRDLYSDPLVQDPEPEPEPELEPDESEETSASSTSRAASEEANDEDDEATRQAKIEESRRKLAELEQDRPLWEQAARQRKEQELRAERERFMSKIKKEEEERRKAANRSHKEQWELEKQAHEREMKKKRKGSQMFVASARLARGTVRWTAKTALERCLDTAAQFDSTQYSASNPLKFQDIPWPMLATSFTINDIEWGAIESFFKTVEGCLSRKDFKDFVERSHKRFHPDRWRSRRILLSVQDILERDLLEIAGSTVAQALTPLWKNVTGRE